MAEMSVQDIISRFQDSLVMYKDKPTYVKRVGKDGSVVILDLFNQRTDTVAFELKDFTAPMRRLGMVNVEGSVIWAYRNPVRRYKVGLSSENFSAEALGGIHYPEGGATTRNKVKSLQIPELADCLFNKYPTLKQACKYLKQFQGAVAFDKQFAITHNRDIVYKRNIVGYLPNKLETTADIVFNEGFKHLGILLDGNYEKPLSNSRA